MDSSEHMGGMDMSSSGGLLRNVNEPLAHDFWFIIAGLVGAMLLLRLFERYEKRVRIQLSSSSNPPKYPTRPQNLLYRVYATVTAIGREISYPQISLKPPFSWLNPPSLGRVLFLFSYWSMVAYMLTRGAITYDAMYYETIGFRAAWISLTQVPLVYLLSSKANTVSFLVGSSYERLNWLHRWVSRTLLVSVTVHGGFFLREWLRAGIEFLKLEMSMLTMVQWGMVAWGILVWMFLTSLSPLRRLAYEFFVLQHIASAAIFLLFLWLHVPAYSRYFVWFSVAALSFDWVLRGSLLCYRNIHFRGSTQRLGYQTHLRSNGHDITVIVVKDVQFSWKPGQHMRIWIPRMGPFETHPLTMANQSLPSGDKSMREIKFVVQAQAGFSRKIHKYSEKMQGEDKTASLTSFISGPYGIPPDWNAYETLVLISASTGASFTLPILESCFGSSTTGCVRRIRYLLLTRKQYSIEFYTPALLKAITRAADMRFDLTIDVAVTGCHEVDEDSVLISKDNISLKEGDQQEGFREDSGDEDVPKENSHCRSHVKIRQSCISDIQTSLSTSRAKERGCNSQVSNGPAASDTHNCIRYSNGRPDIADYIRLAVEATGGETAIVVCAGRSLVSSVRNKVASLSDERAVHKGTGAQGIYVFSEEYSL
ncbi:hypothetical protein BKA65DRAFT_566555 [Rhexocercosporidium sp. MPI-PUGE-AT-0058]|nr:hypothetical protein BKA65DRAFT_566555 [Rhexocercosporidium sp. MPI-PUGE-AT-0058]